MITSILLYGFIGALEWALALLRMLACIRGWRSVVVGSVFLETLLGLFVFKNFIMQDDWIIALAYCTGSALGALCIAHKLEDKAKVS